MTLSATHSSGVRLVCEAESDLALGLALKCTIPRFSKTVSLEQRVQLLNLCTYIFQQQTTIPLTRAGWVVERRA